MNQEADGQIGTKRHESEDVVTKLRQADSLISQGQSVAEAIRTIGVTEVAYYRWHKEFGGLKTDQVRRITREHAIDEGWSTELGNGYRVDRAKNPSVAT